MGKRDAKPAAEQKKVIRCAVYTRKSTEEGLGQAFNSLHAQRDSAEAFVSAQRHEGWVCLPQKYDDGGFSGGNMDRPALRRLAAKSVRGAKKEYPRFFRQGNQLVRVAWSKKDKKEYKHKAPQAVLKALAEAMTKAGADGRIMSTDQFLPINDGEGTEIPSYQAYVGLALIKQAELIDQHGRQGYSIPRLAQFRDDVESVWQKLPAH